MLVKAVQQCLRYAGCRNLLQFDDVQEKRNLFVRITNGLFSDEYTVVSTKSLLTVVDSSVRIIDIFFSCFIRCLHTVAVSFLPQCALWLLHKRQLSEALAHAFLLHSTPASQRAPACQQTGAAASQDNMQCEKYAVCCDFCNRALICSMSLFSVVTNIYVLLLCARLSFGVWTYLRHQLTRLQMTCGFYWDILSKPTTNEFRQSVGFWCSDIVLQPSFLLRTINHG